MKNSSFKFSVLSLLLVGCTGSLKTTKSASNDTTNPSAKENPVDVFGFFRGNTFDVSCPAGMTMTEFGISNPETLELNENPFTQARNTDPVVESYKSVIEFCADFDNLKFQLVAINQLVPSIGAGISPRGHGYKVTKDVDASSFTKALEMGDWSLIDIKFENTDDPANSVWVKNWNLDSFPMIFAGRETTLQDFNTRLIV